MQIYIPRINDRLKLERDWKAELYPCWENLDLLEELKPELKNVLTYDYDRSVKPIKAFWTDVNNKVVGVLPESGTIVIPKGTILKVTLVVIDKTGRDYIKFSFNKSAITNANKGLFNILFQIKEANKIVASIAED